MFFQSKFWVSKEVQKYEVLKNQGLHVKAPIGVLMNVISSGFHQEFDSLDGRAFLKPQSPIQRSIMPGYPALNG